MLYDLVSLQPDGKIFLYLSDNKTYCLLTMYLLCASHLTNVISFKPSHYLSEIGNIITEDETGSESLSKLPKGWWVVSKEDEPAFKKKKKQLGNFRDTSWFIDILTENRALHSVGA